MARGLRMDLHPSLHALPRSRIALALAMIGAMAIVVGLNQPSPRSSTRPPAGVTVVHAAARSTLRAPGGAPPAAASRAPAPAVPSGMRVLGDRISFRDVSAVHPGAPAIAADSGILVDLDARTILWEQQPHVRHAPASTTKVLTSMVALDNFAPTRLVTITPDALTQQGDETVMGLKAGERLTVTELLEGMLMVSGNDAATAMAVDTVGLDRYVAAMNAQARALGLHDSHFTTPVGLDDPGQYASAYDLAVMASVDELHFPLFRSIAATADLDLPQTALHQDYQLTNLNRLLRTYPAAVGIKPGWTGNAGPCLVGMAVRGHHRLIAVLLGAPHLYTDARALLDWGFTQEGLPPLLPPSPAPAPAPRRP